MSLDPPICISSDEHYMRLAIKQAELALDSGEIPVGCVFVNKDGDIVAEGHNKTNESRNVSPVIVTEY